MSPTSPQNVTEQRRVAVLESALCNVAHDSLNDPSTIEIMANPHGSAWLERTGVDITICKHGLAAPDRGLITHRTEYIVYGKDLIYRRIMRTDSVAPTLDIRLASAPVELIPSDFRATLSCL